MPRARRRATSDTASRLSDSTREQIKSYLEGFIQKLIAQSASSEISTHNTTVFAPLLQVPPACGGNQTAVPLAKQGEPHGGGLQKVSCN
jgi:hypothetical protein